MIMTAQKNINLFICFCDLIIFVISLPSQFIGEVVPDLCRLVGFGLKLAPVSSVPLELTQNKLLCDDPCISFTHLRSVIVTVVFVIFQEAGYVPDKLFKAHKRVAAYSYDIEAWSVLIRDAQVSSIISEWNFFLSVNV